MNASDVERDRRGHLYASLILFGCGAAILALSAAHIVALASIARRFSSDGSLSELFMTRLARSQWILGLCLLFASPLPVVAGRTLGQWIEKIMCMKLHEFLAVVFMVTLLLTLAAQRFILHGVPHVTDETCHLFQAKIFAGGRLYAPCPPCFEHFKQPNMVMTDDGKWFSKYPPGQSLLLSLGVVLHIVWLIIPLLTALCAVLTTSLASRFYSASIGRTVGLLCAASPLSLLLGASYMSHVPAQAMLLLGAWLLVRFIDADAAGKRRPGPALAAGFCFGFTAILRPTEFLLAGLIGLASLALAIPRARTSLLKSIPLIVAGLAPPLVLFLFYNRALFGSPFAMGYSASSPHLLSHIYQDHYGLSGPFTVKRALQITFWTLLRFDSACDGWPVTLAFIIFALANPSRSRADMLSLAAMAIVIGFYFFYDYFGSEYEARYYFLALPFALALAVRGIQCLCNLAAGWLGTGARAGVATLMAAFFAYGLIAYWRDYIVPTYSRDYEQATPALERLAQEKYLNHAIVLIDTSGPNGFRYSSGFPYNDPMLAGPVIYARDMPESNMCLARAFPNRTMYRFEPNDDWRDGRFEEVAAAH